LAREHGWAKDHHVEAQLARKEEGVAGAYNQATNVVTLSALNRFGWPIPTG
jgi:hypothetical protein